jgi:uncharacterized protein YjbI with pentapeptide repeats
MNNHDSMTEKKMRKFKLVTTENKTIYEGYHSNLKQTVEYAVTHNINIHGIDLSNTDLRHINLDGVLIVDANFNGSNLSGANMSEAEFINCDFSKSNLSNACLCYSNINRCNLKYTHFFETDIAMSSFVFCDFQGISSLQLDYHKAFKLEALTFTHLEEIIPFSAPPTLIRQGEKYIAILDKVMFYNDKLHTFDDIALPESM